ncbi:MAG: ABC transporter ATP-binding protein [Eubacteriales bacterium]|nr:ABC transporter ATP-binding protein [Eubacteriales bacterium]
MEEREKQTGKGTGAEGKKPSPLAVCWGWAGDYHRGFYGAVFLAAAGVACSMAAYVLIAAMIRQLLSGREVSHILPLCGALLAVCAGKAVCSTASTAMSHRATYYTLRDLRKRLLAKLSRMPMGVISDTPSGQYKTTIVDRVEGMEPTLAHLLPEMTSNLLVPIVIAVYIFSIDWRMGLASLATTVIGIITASQSGKTYAVRWEGAVAVGKRMANAIVEYVGGIQVVKAFSQSAGSYRKYSGAVEENAAYYVDWMRDNQKYLSVMQTVIPAVLLTVLPAGMVFWRNGSLSTADFLTVVVLSLGFTGPFLAAMSFVDELAVVGTNVGEICGILDAPELNRPEKAVSLDGEEIRLEQVSFTYGNAREQVLHQIDLVIKPGTVTALVGPSGSGKSTIARLIAGFWDVTGGRITMGGRDLREIPLDQLNSRIAYVSQDNYLFDRTVRDNIRMGRLDATDQEVEEAAKAAGCDSFIRGLEHGYDTVCGGGGGHLSGGEKQRISIARAMLKDAPVIILDEATASMDPENEALIQRAISALTKGKTLIVIAHRLATIQDADHIVVLEHGQIAGEGRQEELLKSCPLYGRLWTAALGSRDEE